MLITFWNWPSLIWQMTVGGESFVEFVWQNFPRLYLPANISSLCIQNLWFVVAWCSSSWLNRRVDLTQNSVVMFYIMFVQNYVAIVMHAYRHFLTCSCLRNEPTKKIGCVPHCWSIDICSTHIIRLVVWLISSLSTKCVRIFFSALSLTRVEVESRPHHQLSVEIEQISHFSD